MAGLPPFKLLIYFPELGRNAGKVIFGSHSPGMTDIMRNIETVAALYFTPGTVGKSSEATQPVCRASIPTRRALL